MFNYTYLLFLCLILIFVSSVANTNTVLINPINSNSIKIKPIIIETTKSTKSTKSTKTTKSTKSTHTNKNKIKSITLEPNNFVAISGSINENSVNMWIRNISSIEKQKIYVYINSNGGSVKAGQKLIDYFSYLQQKGIIIECIAQNAYSMAFQILQSCDKRYITPSATVMQHQMSVSELGGQFENLLNYLTMIKQMSNDLDTIAAKRIGISYQEYKLKISTDWWLYGKEIIKANVADEIVYIGCSKKLYEMFSYDDKIDFDVAPDGYLELKKTKYIVDLCPL